MLRALSTLAASNVNDVGVFATSFLFSFRGSTGEDLEKEKENEKEIREALDQSKRAMRFGDTFGAVSALEGVKQVQPEGHHRQCDRLCNPAGLG